MVAFQFLSVDPDLERRAHPDRHDAPDNCPILNRGPLAIASEHEDTRHGIRHPRHSGARCHSHDLVGSLKTKSDPERTECLRGRTPAWSGSLPYTTIDATRVRRIRDSASRPGARRGVWPSATSQPPAAADILRACGMATADSTNADVVVRHPARVRDGLALRPPVRELVGQPGDDAIDLGIVAVPHHLLGGLPRHILLRQGGRVAMVDGEP